MEKTVPSVYKEIVNAVNEVGSSDLNKCIPTYRSIKSRVYRRRCATLKVKKMAHKIMSEVEVPPIFTEFLLADYEYLGDRILIFVSKQVRKVIEKLTSFSCDGTFQICPPPFYQLFSIHADFGSTVNHSRVFPMIYALLPNKKVHTYVTMLKLIKKELPSFNPTKFVTDFEAAIIKAIKIVFPRVEHHGCYFHYTNGLTKKANKLKMTKYEQRKCVGLCKVLPLLPEDHIFDGWKYIQQEISAVAEMKSSRIEKFLTYMRKYWMRKDYYKVWCCFGHAQRTTNALESWHNKMTNEIKKKPNTLYKFLVNIQKNAVSYDVFVAQLQNDIEPQQKRRKEYINRDEYIQNSQMQLLTGVIDVGYFLEKLRF